MRRVLYVDFENVSSAGLNGVLKLTKNDEVKIFLGPKCSKMSLIEAESVLHCDATVELIKNDQIGKNALDFIIMVHLGYDIAKGEGDAFFIISNDKGYEPAIHEMQSKTGETIERYPDIEHVVARKDENLGFFARLFGKKKPVVENTTEHEVLKKGNRTSQGRGNGSRYGAGSRSGNGSRYGSRSGASAGTGRSGNNSGTVRNGGSAGGNANQAANSGRSGNNTGSRNNVSGSANSVDTVRNSQSVKKTESAASAVPTKVSEPVKKPSYEAKREAAKAKQPKTKPAAPANDIDDSYLDNLSIADLRAQLSAGAAPAPQSAPASKPAAQAKTGMTEAERALVERALAETDNLGDFHNYILKELHDNDRATEIYKAEKYRVGKKNN